MLLIFRKTINAENVIFALVQLIRGAILAVNKQYAHFVYVIFYALLYLIGRGIIIFAEDILKIPNISNHKKH